MRALAIVMLAACAARPRPVSIENKAPDVATAATSECVPKAVVQPGHGAVHGIVRGASTGEPLAGATVALTTGPGEAYFVTDETGCYFVATAAGRYTVTYYFFESATPRTVDIEPNQLVTIDMRIPDVPAKR